MSDQPNNLVPHKHHNHLHHAQQNKPAPIGIPSVSKEQMAAAPKTPADEAIDFFESDIHPGEAPIQVYELKLEEDGGPNKSRAYTRLPPPYKPYILRVSLEAGTPPCKNGVFKTNFPLNGGAFERSTFVERIIPAKLSKPVQVDLPISHAGAFVYWIEYDDELGHRVKGREGYFNVDPILRVPHRKKILSSHGQIVEHAAGGGGVIKSQIGTVPLDGLTLLTAVSKWMGTVEEWHPHLREASLKGYNMIHYTPLQQRGESKSPYSIADQLAFDEGLFSTATNSKDGTELVRQTLKEAKEEFGLLSLIDVVLNHTANNSPWLIEHPEAGYSPENTPHLAPALELDDCIVAFSKSLESRGLPTFVRSEDDIQRLMTALDEDIKHLKLYEFYIVNVEKAKSDLLRAVTRPVAGWEGSDVFGKTEEELAKLLKESNGVTSLGALSDRYCVTVDAGHGLSLLTAAYPHIKDDKTALAEKWVTIMNIINVDLYREWEVDAAAAHNQIMNRLRYTRLDEHGPKIGEITGTLPLVDTYFTRVPPNPKLAHELSYKARCLANNGWIWDADPLANFALRPSKAYLRREVIAWGDCVKLRYGSGPEANPWLWHHMTKYVQTVASMFDGFRIDNCHSTPLNVGMHMLDKARVINPDLYVAAELFTGSQEMDLHFVSRLGINSLIREAYNGSDPKDMSRLLYSFGLGKPVGSMDGACLTSPEDIPSPVNGGPSRPGLVTPLQGSVPHALFYDLTHDNETPLFKRSAEDALATGALVAFSWCAIGSVKGFDELFPKLLDLVGDNRHYEKVPAGEKHLKGIGEAKRLLNHLHTEMVIDGYSEGHVHQENDYIVMHRIHPGTQKGYLLVAHTGFTKGNKERGWIAPFKLRRTTAKFIYGATLQIENYDISKDPKIIHGLPGTLRAVSSVSPHRGADQDGEYSEVVVPDYFPPGSIMVFSTQMEGIDTKLDTYCKQGAQEAFDGLDLVGLNVLLHRCDGEERDATGGEIGIYNVPNCDPLVYCGLEGWMHPLRHIMKTNDLGHPLCAHLREGTWAMDYIHTRLEKQVALLPQLAKPAAWFKSRFDKIKETVPNFLRPKYFAIVNFEAYKAARRAVMEQCTDFVSNGHSFTQDLALTSVQMYGLVGSASLDPGKQVPCLAAGLPHFAAGWARTWGRDVFISLRGLLLTTGNYDAAKKHILAFVSVLKHGLIPNLLDSLRTPRYNSRDSPWWMLQNIQDFTKMAPEGLSILSETVSRRFPQDETWVPWDDERAYSWTCTVADAIQEILQRHATGIHFREYNAGPNIDGQMKPEGFNIDINVDWSTGLIHGGNQFNCGTWMDKMGESQKAGTKGKPGSPRDGAPVEITGLLKSTLTWLDHLSSKGQFPYKGVEATVHGKHKLVSYKEWADLLQKSFEKHYYIPVDPADDHKYEVNSKMVNQRGIYKDVHGTPKDREWSDYQLRPNYPIAMTVAPELFDPRHAIRALQIADKLLRSPMGMRTLDPADLQFRPVYDNSNDSDDPTIAKGMNYHNGPEWGWPLGFFLRAYLHFDSKVPGRNIQDTLHVCYMALLQCRRHIQEDPWRGIPEVTHPGGTYCHDSCHTQAWSNSTLLDFLEDVHRLQKD